MGNREINNVKLGAFVLGGLLFLVLLLYMIGVNRSLFGATFVLKARFENVQGLVAGNNVRFSGIQTGTVKNITILNDTVIEVSMIVDKKMLRVIRNNALVSIGTDGLVGNKVVNIVPSKVSAPLAIAGDVLQSKKAVSPDEMLQTLYTTNNDIAVIAANLKTTVQRINGSSAIWQLLDEPEIPRNVRLSVANIRLATAKANNMADNLDRIISDVRGGKGLLGAIVKDESIAKNMQEAVIKIKKVGEQADSLTGELRAAVAGIRLDITKGNGPVRALLRDSLLLVKLTNSLDNIQQGSEGFNQNMEAVKHSFLLRGYFRKLERKKHQKGKD